MQLPLSTFSKIFAASVFLSAWTAVVQGAAINAKEARSAIVDVAKDGLLRRINAPADDAWYTAADVSVSAKRGEAIAGRNADLSRRVKVPVDDAWYTVNGASALTERDLSGRGGDSWYTLETRGDLAERVPLEEPWYTLAERAEESE